jgi:hypothetical protein
MSLDRRLDVVHNRAERSGRDQNLIPDRNKTPISQTSTRLFLLLKISGEINNYFSSFSF